MVIINVATTIIIKIFEFLVGCITIFIAYTVLGSCLFGTYDTTFRSFIDSAECLLAVIHGDSIQTMFNEAGIWPDLSVWFGILYWGLWIFFSLTIMFNISISIFEEVLTKEIYKTAKEAHERDHADEGINLSCRFHCHIKKFIDFVVCKYIIIFIFCHYFFSFYYYR